MKNVKLIVMYPQPTDVEMFERRYVNELVPMAIEKLAGKTHLAASLIMNFAGKKSAPFHRIAEVYFPSMQALEDCFNSAIGQEIAWQAIEISTGGTPQILIAEVENFDF